MSNAEKDEYLKVLLGEDDQSDNLSDSEDEDWFPNENAPKSGNAEASDTEDYVDDKAEINGGTQEEEEDDDDGDERDAEEEIENEVASDVSASTRQVQLLWQKIKRFGIKLRLKTIKLRLEILLGRELDHIKVRKCYRSLAH